MQKNAHLRRALNSKVGEAEIPLLVSQAVEKTRVSISLRQCINNLVKVDFNKSSTVRDLEQELSIKREPIILRCPVLSIVSVGFPILLVGGNLIVSDR